MNWLSTCNEGLTSGELASVIAELQDRLGMIEECLDQGDRWTALRILRELRDSL